MSNNHIRSFKN